MSTNFVGNTLTQSEAIETYTPYDVTSSRPRKTTTAFFANFRGRERLFCAPDQTLNSKNYESVRHGLQFSGIKKGAKISFHRHFNTIIVFCFISNANLFRLITTVRFFLSAPDISTTEGNRYLSTI